MVSPLRPFGVTAGVTSRRIRIIIALAVRCYGAEIVNEAVRALGRLAPTDEAIFPVDEIGLKQTGCLMLPVNQTGCGHVGSHHQPDL